MKRIAVYGLAFALSGAMLAADKPAKLEAKGATTNKKEDAALMQIDEMVQKAAVDKSNASWRTKLPKPTVATFDAKHTYFANMQTSKGAIKIKFMPDVAPMHVTSTIYLTKLGFYDGVVFHRIIPGFVLQGGDPQGTGTGGPGYRFEDELPQPGRYEVGSLAMANAGPNTNGSQFFVISGPDGVRLPPLYSLFGKVVAGLDVVETINALGSGSGTPKEKVVIESVTITEAD